MLRASLALALALAPAGCQRPGTPRSDARPSAGQAEAVLTVLATAEVRGTPEPCGCQSDPLGDVARVATLLTEARTRGGALLVDAGGLRFGVTLPSAMSWAQAAMKAEFLEEQWASLGALVGVGDEDLLDGPARVPAGRRLCANCIGLPTVPSRTVKAGALTVGVFAVIDPALFAEGLTRAAQRPSAERSTSTPVAAGDPTAAARREVAALRGAGATVIVAALHMPRAAARSLVRAVPGITIAVVGDEVGDAGAQVERVAETLVVQPADQAQRVARVELHVRDGRVSTQLFAGTEDREREALRLDRKIDQVARDLAALASDPQADPSFLATKVAEQQRLRAQREALRRAPTTPPTTSYATAELAAVRRRLARDPECAAAMKALDRRVGESNRRLAEAVPPPPAARGEAHYVGIEDCENCHRKAVQQWRSTIHARAWEELVKLDKQWSYDCIGCHVTGYGRAGGTAMAHVDGLTDVQCEVCHGPGSLHSDEPKRYRLENPTEADCKGCHTPDHSDTFHHPAYLRDIVGAGHGMERRTALGEGPTGHELRHGALERAKQL